MKKILVASVSALSLMGLAACADVDDGTTQGMEPMDTQDPAAAPAPEGGDLGDPVEPIE